MTTDTDARTVIENAVEVHNDGWANFVTSSDDRVGLNAVITERRGEDNPLTWASVAVNAESTPKVTHFEECSRHEEFVSIKFSDDLSVYVSLAQWEALKSAKVEVVPGDRKVNV